MLVIAKNNFNKKHRFYKGNINYKFRKPKTFYKGNGSQYKVQGGPIRKLKKKKKKRASAWLAFQKFKVLHFSANWLFPILDKYSFFVFNKTKYKYYQHRFLRYFYFLPPKPHLIVKRLSRFYRSVKRSRFKEYFIVFSETVNNFFVSLLDKEGHLYFCVSSGKVGYKGPKRKSKEAIESIMKRFLERLDNFMVKDKIGNRYKHVKELNSSKLSLNNYNQIAIVLKMLPRNKFARWAIKCIYKNRSLRPLLSLVICTYPCSHNGLRPKKARRT